MLILDDIQYLCYILAHRRRALTQPSIEFETGWPSVY